MLALICSIGFLSGTGVRAQTPTAWGYSTGYGNVYGTFGLAQTMQSMYNVARAQSRTRSETRPVSASTEKRTATPSIQARPAVRNYGVFVPDPGIDTGRVLSDSLGDTPEHRDLIRKIYGATQSSFAKEAAERGWKNNMAGGLTFFTATAMTVYHDAPEPSEAAIAAYFKLMNSTLDEIPELRNVSNRDKQNFNNMAVGFAGILLAGYVEGKQTGDAETLANYRKLAGGLINLVLKVDPDKLVIEDGQIALK